MDPSVTAPAPVLGDQIELRWTAAGDFRPVANSAGLRPSWVDYIWDEFRDLARSQADLPVASSVVFKPLYAQFADDLTSLGVILLRQRLRTDPIVGVGARDTSRTRIVTRVLVVPDLRQAARVALGICAGGLADLPGPPPGAVSVGQPLPRVEAARLERIAGWAGPDPTFWGDRRMRDLLVALAARLITAPDARLAVQLPGSGDVPVAAAGTHSTAAQLQVLLGLSATAGRLLENLPLRAGRRRPWDGSFSTFEVWTDRDPDRLPQLIFEPPGDPVNPGTFVPIHSTVWFEAPLHGVDIPAERLLAAQLLVDHYLERDPDLEELLDSFAAKGLDLTPRLQRLQAVLGAGPVAPVLAPPQVTQPAFTQPGLARPTPRQAVPDATPMIEPTASADPVADGQQPPVPAAAATPILRLEEVQEAVRAGVAPLRGEIERLTQEIADLRSRIEDQGSDAGAGEPRSVTAAVLLPFGTDQGAARWANALFWMMVAFMLSMIVLLIRVS